MRWVYKSLYFSFIPVLMGVSAIDGCAQGFEVCQLYGVVYITDDPNQANFRVYVEDSEAFADLVVFREDNRLMADRPGIWFITETLAFANFSIFIEENRGLADFAIFYTDIQSFAGCNN